jgi:Family of unknown function (DUF6260)
MVAARVDVMNFDPEAPASIDLAYPGSGNQSGGITLAGGLANRLLDSELDPRVLRPYRGRDGRSYVSRLKRDSWGVPVYNTQAKKFEEEKVLTNDDTNATLRILDWIQLDEAVIQAAKPRLRAAADLRSAGLVYSLPNGIAKTVIQFQQQSDISGATVSMDGLRQSESDRPYFTTVNFPLPIIHKDFQYPLRQLLASRTGYSPLDTTTAALAGRRVAEQVEQFTLGTTNPLLLGQSSYSWGGGSIYGFMNWPSRITYSITQPTSAGWIPQNTVDDILSMKKLSQLDNHFGPWQLYFGLGWDPYMDEDYKPTYNDMTLRQRIREIDGILDARTVDYIPDMSLVMVQQTTDVARMVIGMDITTVQWESHGGMQMNFKVLCVMLPQLRTDSNGNTGVVHGS